MRKVDSSKWTFNRIIKAEAQGRLPKAIKETIDLEAKKIGEALQDFKEGYDKLDKLLSDSGLTRYKDLICLIRYGDQFHFKQLRHNALRLKELNLIDGSVILKDDWYQSMLSRIQEAEKRLDTHRVRVGENGELYSNKGNGAVTLLNELIEDLQKAYNLRNIKSHRQRVARIASFLMFRPTLLKTRFTDPIGKRLEYLALKSKSKT